MWWRWAQADLDKAKKTLLMALQMDPDHGECQRDLKLVKKLQTLHQTGNEAFEVRGCAPPALVGGHVPLFCYPMWCAQSSRWAAAIDAYTQALALDPANSQYNAKLYGNRAAAYIK